MEFCTEINYTIRINTDIGDYYFTKESIYNYNDKWEPMYEETKSRYVYETFLEKYPILKIFERKDVKITRCWSVSHPITKENQYENKYDRNKDEFVTGCFQNWYEKQTKNKNITIN